MELKHCLVVAESTNHMLSANKIISEIVETDLVPAPPEYGTVCAIAIKIPIQFREQVKRIIEKNNISARIFDDKPRKLEGLLNKNNTQKVSTAFINIMTKLQDGKDLTHDEIVILLSTENPLEIDLLYKAADKMRQQIVGDVVEIRAAIEFSNICRKNCNYCGLRAENETVQRYRMTEDEIMERVHDIRKLGIKTVILQSGEDLWWTQGKIVGLLKRIKDETGMKITLSIGERSREEYEVYKNAGTNNFLLKIEAANRELFEKIHPDDDYDKRVQGSKDLKELGYLNGSGNIVGLPGQTIDDIAADILFFKEMGINMIGIGPFVPAKGSPYENLPAGSVEMTLKTVAVTRLVCKTVYIPATTALASIDPEGQEKALMSGANTIMLISTPDKYKKSYRIYDNKNMVDVASAINAVKAVGRKLPDYLKIGDIHESK